MAQLPHLGVGKRVHGVAALAVVVLAPHDALRAQQLAAAGAALQGGHHHFDIRRIQHPPAPKKNVTVTCAFQFEMPDSLFQSRWGDFSQKKEIVFTPIPAHGFTLVHGRICIDCVIALGEKWVTGSSQQQVRGLKI